MVYGEHDDTTTTTVTTTYFTHSSATSLGHLYLVRQRTNLFWRCKRAGCHHIYQIPPSNRRLGGSQGRHTRHRRIQQPRHYVRTLSLSLRETDATSPLVFVASHGRDNKIHVWQRPTESVPIRRGGAASLTDQPAPPLCYSLIINALNFCRFSLLPSSSSDSEVTALIAVPNLVESALVGSTNTRLQPSYEHIL